MSHYCVFFFFKQKTAYEMRISDWSSDVCSSDLADATHVAGRMLSQRLAIGPSHARDVETWVDAGLATRVRRSIDGRGLPRSDDWFAGHGDPVPLIGLGADVPASDVLGDVLKKAEANERFTESDKIGRAHVRTPVTNAHLVCRLLLET